MENHREKLEIFNQYANSENYRNWAQISREFVNNILSGSRSEIEAAIDEFEEHILNATDLVQKEAIKRASENVRIKLKENLIDLSINDEFTEIDKKSILSDENLVK